MILRMVCPKCGENVQKVVLCNWDSESQEFLYGDIKPGLHYWCHACGDIEQPVHITRSASEERLYQRMQWSECNRASLIEEFLEDPAEIERSIKLFAAASPEMQEIAEAVIIGEHEDVDSLLATAQLSVSAI